MEFIYAGAALLIQGRIVSVVDPHLWFILTDPDPVTDHVVCVMVVTPQIHTDKTTVLTAADHPWLRYDSNIDYGGAQKLKAARLRAGLSTGECVSQPDMPKRLLAVIRKGFQDSARAIPAIQQYCAARCQ